MAQLQNGKSILTSITNLPYRHQTSRRVLELLKRVTLPLVLSLSKMPPKRTARGLNKVSTPARTKLEDVDVEPLLDATAKRPSASSLAKRAAMDSGDDSSGPARRRSPRKRVRLDLKEPDDDDSSLTSMDPASEDEYVEASSSAPAASMSLDQFAYSASRPTRSARTPSKGKLEESASPFPKDEDTKANLDEKKPKGAARKASSTASPSKKPKKQKGIVMELDIPHPTPENWRRQYTLIEEMRAELEAPVDTMGCESSMTGQGPLKVRFTLLLVHMQTDGLLSTCWIM